MNNSLKMKQQTTALLISALLLSTFAHEHLLRAHHQSRKNHLAYRDNEDQCHWVCPSTEPTPSETTSPSGEQHTTEPSENTSGQNEVTTEQPEHPTTQGEEVTTEKEETTTEVEPTSPEGKLTVVFNETSSIVAIYNSSAHVAWAYDASSNLVAVFNGKSGSAVLINIERNTGIYVSAEKSRELWVLYESSRHEGISFTSTSVSTQVSEVIGGVLVHLSSDLAAQFSASYSLSYKVLIEYSGRISTLFRGSLKGFFSVVRSTSVVVQGDIKWFVGVLDGFGQFVSQVKGGIQVLVKKQVRFDLQVILTAKSGVEAFAYVVRTVSASYNISYMLTYERVFGLIVKFGGNASKGFAGFVKVISSIIGLSKGKASIDIVIDALLEYSVTEKSEISAVSEQWSSSLSILIEVTQKVSVSGSHDGLIKMLQDLKENRLVISGIQVSKIVTSLMTVGGATSLTFIVNILYQIKTAVKLEVSVATFFYVLIVRLTSVSTSKTVAQVIPGIKFDKESKTASGGILGLVLKGTSVTTIQQCLNGDFSQVPVIRNIYNSLGVAVKTVTRGSLKIQGIFKSHYAASIVSKVVSTMTLAAQGKITQEWGLNLALGGLEWGHSTENSSEGGLLGGLFSYGKGSASGNASGSGHGHAVGKWGLIGSFERAHGLHHHQERHHEVKGEHERSGIHARHHAGHQHPAEKHHLHEKHHQQ